MPDMLPDAVSIPASTVAIVGAMRVAWPSIDGHKVPLVSAGVAAALYGLLAIPPVAPFARVAMLGLSVSGALGGAGYVAGKLPGAA